MFDDFSFKFDSIVSSIDDINACYSVVDSIFDLCESDDCFVFVIYKFNCLFLDYLYSVDCSCVNEKYKNVELYKLNVVSSEKKNLLFSLSLNLLDQFKGNEVVNNSNYYILFGYFISKVNSLNVIHDSLLNDLVDEEVFDIVMDDSDIDFQVSNENNDLENKIGVAENYADDNLENSSVKCNSKKFFRFFILYLLFIIVGLVFVILIFNFDDKIELLENDYNDLLGEYTIEEKIQYIESIKGDFDITNSSFENFKNEINNLDSKIELISQENENLSSELSSRTNELNNKKSIYNDLNDQYVKLSLHKIDGVITFNQYPNYPNGCEAVALYILLRYYNVNVSVDSVMDALPIGSVPYSVNGVMYGGDPNVEFLGDPRSTSGWGIYDKGLSITADKFKPNIINGTGMNFSRIYSLIDSGRPVIVWTSVNLKDPYEHGSWISDKTGETIVWKRFNHAVVVIGYSDDYIVVSDPIDGKIKYFDKDKFIYTYNFMGKRALYY